MELPNFSNACTDSRSGPNGLISIKCVKDPKEELDEDNPDNPLSMQSLFKRHEEYEPCFTGKLLSPKGATEE